MAVTRDYNKPLHEEEPYLVQNKSLGTNRESRLVTHTDWYGNPITDPDRSNPTRNRHESPLQTIMSFEYAIAREENDMVSGRPTTAVTNPRYSYAAAPSRRTSSYSYAAGQSGKEPRQDYRDSRVEYATRDSRQESSIPIPPQHRGDYVQRDYRRDSTNGFGNGESSGASSYNNYSHDQYAGQPSGQEYSPPSTPTRGASQFPGSSSSGAAGQYHFPQSYGLPSPEPDDFPRGGGVGVGGIPAAPNRPVHQFTARPATPPGSDVADSPKAGKKEKKTSKFKRFSVLGKSKS